MRLEFREGTFRRYIERTSVAQWLWEMERGWEINRKENENSRERERGGRGIANDCLRGFKLKIKCRLLRMTFFNIIAGSAVKFYVVENTCNYTAI